MTTNTEEAKRCRNCGCYDYVHDPAYAYFGPHVDHRFSRATRVELWFKDHGTIWDHVEAWSWIYLRSDRSRMAYIERKFARHPELCWCSLVDSWWKATKDMREHECVCYFPMPRYVQPSHGGCYCTPGESE